MIKNKLQKFNITFVFIRRYFLCSFLVLLIFLTFYPCLKANFITFDDPQHFLNNDSVLVLTVDSVESIFSQTVNNIYIPLSTLSFAIEHFFFGFNTFVFHLDNILLHIIVVLLVFFLAKRMGLSVEGAFFAALIFGIHPMKVESVAWATERKDVLYSFFYVLALHQYWSYLNNKSISSYLWTLVFGLISMLAKPMALSLPLILFLFDRFSGRLINKNVFVEKIPFLIYIAEIGSLSYLFNLRNPINDILQAVLTWIWCFDFYIWKFIWPYHVSFIYIIPQPISLNNFPYMCSLLMFILIIGAVIRWRKNRFLFFAFGYYFFSIFFILRFDNQVDFTIVSDRFMYLPCLGFCLLAGAGVGQYLKPKKFLIPFVVLYIVFAGFQTFQQCQIWHDDISLLSDAINRYPKFYKAYYCRGVGYGFTKQYDLALSDFTRAIDLNPIYIKSYNMRAKTYAFLGRYKEALKDINTVIMLDQSNIGGYLSRADIEEQAHDFLHSKEDYIFFQQMSGILYKDKIDELNKKLKIQG